MCDAVMDDSFRPTPRARTPPYFLKPCVQIVLTTYSPFLPLTRHANSPKLGAITQTRLRHRHHHLSAVRWPVDHPHGARRSCGNHQNSHTPGLAEPEPRHAPRPASTRSCRQPKLPPGFRFGARTDTPPLPVSTLHATMERHAGPILGKWAGQTLLAG